MLDGEDSRETQVAEDLVSRIMKGDQAAESSLVERYSKGLLFMLRRRTRDAQLSDDLHQETFLIVLVKIKDGKLDEPTRLGGYIHRVAVNLVIADHRKSSKWAGDAPEAELDQIVDRGLDQLDGVIAEEEARLVRRVIDELSNERDRQILFRFYVAEQDKKEIMANLKLDPLHFNRVLYRARQRFAEQWRKGSRTAMGGLIVVLMIFGGIMRADVSVTY